MKRLLRIFAKRSTEIIVIYSFVLGFFTWMTIPLVSIASSGTIYYVSPDGSDTNSGTSLSSQFKTIQKAINEAQPNSTIELASGEYYEDIISFRDGTEVAPITITGPSDAVVKGGGNDRIIEINHDYHILNGFTVDGLHGSKTNSSGYRDILIYVLGKQVRQGVEGLKVTNMTLKNAGGECLRLRYFVTKSEIAYNTITDCGVYDFVFDSGGKNGEGIYVGTSNKQWGDGKNPTDDPDETRDNIIHNNYIETNGNECVDIKEGATTNIVEYNTCLGQRDSESGGFDSRGSGNVFRYNDVRESIGAGIRLGGWKVNGVQYGLNNDVYGNIIIGNKNGGIKFQKSPQGKVCGNIMSDNTGGNSVGDFGSNFDPSASCDGSTTTPPPPSSIGSLANDSTLTADSKNFSNGYNPSKLWDGCYTGSSYNPNTCTTGGREMASFWLEFDFGTFYDLSEARLYGDKEGEWISKTWTLTYKRDSGNQWKKAFSNKNALLNDWSIQPLKIKARFVRVEVFGDSKNFSPGRTQARELEIYGTESAVQTDTPPFPPASGKGNRGRGISSSSGGGSGRPVSPAIETGDLASSQSVAVEKMVLFTKPLFWGISNEQTRRLQTLFAKDSTLYPEGFVTGYFGTLTKQAVERFQCRYNIVCDGDEWTTGYGRVGPKTRAKLNEVYARGSLLQETTDAQISQMFTQQLSVGMQNNDVHRLQTLFAKDSTLYPEGFVTGYFGTLTKQAVERFQCRYNIVCDGDEWTTGYGRVGPKTLRQLNQT